MIVHFVESLGGIQAVHAFRREPRNQEIFEHLNDRYRRANLWSQRLAAAYGPGVQLIGRMTTAVVVFYGGWLAIDGHVSVGVLAAFLLYLRRFFEPMQELSQFYNLFQAAVAGLEKLSGVLEAADGHPRAPHHLRHAQGALQFNAVDFAYRERPILTDLDLDIPGGQTLAVVGMTGAGKTTIARLAARFWDPTAGHVTLDGVDLRDLEPDDLSRAIVTVTPENSCSVRSPHIGLAARSERAEIEDFGRSAHAGPAPSGRLPPTRTVGRPPRPDAPARRVPPPTRPCSSSRVTSSLDIPPERFVQRAADTARRPHRDHHRPPPTTVDRRPCARARRDARRGRRAT